MIEKDCRDEVGIERGKTNIRIITVWNKVHINILYKVQSYEYPILFNSQMKSKTFITNFVMAMK